MHNVTSLDRVTDVRAAHVEDVGSVDDTRDGPARHDLGLHGRRAAQAPVLRHDQALVFTRGHWRASLVRVRRAGEAPEKLGVVGN